MKCHANNDFLGKEKKVHFRNSFPWDHCLIFLNKVLLIGSVVTIHLRINFVFPFESCFFPELFFLIPAQLPFSTIPSWINYIQIYETERDKLSQPLWWRLIFLIIFFITKLSVAIISWRQHGEKLEAYDIKIFRRMQNKLFLNMCIEGIVYPSTS